MTKHILSVLAFMVISFAAQGLSHFVINVEHFASISFMRPDPVIPLGLFVMIVQGVLMSFALSAWKGTEVTAIHGLQIVVVFGTFLASYIALVEPSKYAVPSISAWIMVEASVSVVQFAIFGVVLGLIHQRSAMRQGRQAVSESTG